MLIFSLIVCCGLLITANLAIRAKSGTGLVVVVGASIAAVIIPAMCLMMTSGLIITHAILMLLLAGVCRNPSPKQFATASVLLTLAAIGFSSWQAYESLGQDDDLREKYPLVSLAERLAPVQSSSGQLSVEDTTNNRPDNDLIVTDIAMVQLNVDVESRLTSIESELDFRLALTSRERGLEQIHASTVNRFIESPGFGVGRMSNYSKEQLRDPDYPESQIPDLPLPQPPLPQPSAESAGEQATDESPIVKEAEIQTTTNPSAAAISKLHEASVVDFVNPDGFGYIKSRDQIAGFQPHHFGSVPEFSGENSGTWQISQLQLVSLQRHRPARVYVSKELPRMDRLPESATRALTAFENTALRRLVKGEDVVTLESRDRIRMFGSIRAMTVCIKCHDVQRGRLLGAFSYEFARSKPKRPDKPKPRQPI